MKKWVHIFTFFMLTVSMPQLLADEEAAEMAGARAEREQMSRSGEGEPVREEFQSTGPQGEFVAGEKTGGKLAKAWARFKQTLRIEPAPQSQPASPTASPVPSTPSESPQLRYSPSEVAPQRTQSAPTTRVESNWTPPETRTRSGAVGERAVNQAPALPAAPPTPRMQMRIEAPTPLEVPQARPMGEGQRPSEAPPLPKSAPKPRMQIRVEAPTPVDVPQAPPLNPSENVPKAPPLGGPGEGQRSLSAGGRVRHYEISGETSTTHAAQSAEPSGNKEAFAKTKSTLSTDQAETMRKSMSQRRSMLETGRSAASTQPVEPHAQSAEHHTGPKPAAPPKKFTAPKRMPG